MKFLRGFIIVLWLTMFAWGVMAQDSVEFPDGNTILLDPSWKLTHEATDDEKFTQIESDVVELVVTFYFYTTETMEEKSLTRPEDLAEYDYAFYDVSKEQPFTVRNLRDNTVNDLPTVEYTFVSTSSKGEKYDTTVIYYIAENGAGIVTEVNPYFVDTAVDLEPVYDLLSTMTNTTRSSNAGNASSAIFNANTEEFTLLDGTILKYPSGWLASAGSDSGVYFLDRPNGTGSATILLYTGFVAIEEFNTVEKFLRWELSNNYPTVAFNASAIKDAELGDFPSVYYDFIAPVNKQDVEKRAIVLQLPNDNYIIAYVSDSADFSGTVDAVMNILKDVDVSASITCIVAAPQGSNFRSAPSTTASIARTVENANGEFYTADAVTQDASGVFWFHVLEIDAFVRQDVVFFENNSCAKLPVK